MVMPVGVGGVQYNVRYTIPRDVIQYVSLLSGLFLDQAPNYPNVCIKFLPYSLRRDFLSKKGHGYSSLYKSCSLFVLFGVLWHP